MAEIKSEIRGVKDVDRLLSRIAPREARNIMRSSVHGVAGEIRKEARRNTPKDEGDLRKAIKTKRRRGTSAEVRSDVIVERRAFYWRFLEFGTVKLTEVRMFGRAVEWFEGRRKDVMLTQFGKKFESALARARKRASR